MSKIEGPVVNCNCLVAGPTLKSSLGSFELTLKSVFLDTGVDNWEVFTERSALLQTGFWERADLLVFRSSPPRLNPLWVALGNL